MACPRLPAALREAGPPPEAAGVLYKSLRARPEAEEAGQAMAKVGSRRVGRSCRGRGQRRPTTWEISDSDTEGPVGAGADSEAAVRARDPAEQRRAEAEALRLLRPKQALRRLAVRVDPAILEDAGADILMEALGSLGCEYHIEPQRPARSLRWSRVKPEPCPCSICGPACSVPWISPESPTCLHLAVIGLDAYLWSHQPNAQEMQQPESPGVARAEVAVGWPEVEEALVLLQLWANLDVLLVASWQELSQHVCAFTKALAQRPFKQFQESGTFSFCTAGRWTAGERVTKDGTGLRGAWWRQIRQFNRVSPAVADAVVTAFPSPRLLQQAYLACSTDQERLALLADLPVKVDEGARPRRVGPDLSRRICLFLTSTNPDLLLDLSS
ncbi:probable crossover junction endonuclease EME2 isoform X2 [Myotis myotis]|uniref:probable crossover junction endonuclease EME2 isoform X2 n=1 Tax=Myotis myotis TaxID=51298 RepID=UPI00174D4644|nr:probable crossover junction endonuclease EME2 isoform X2 [Myotis myotis]